MSVQAIYYFNKPVRFADLKKARLSQNGIGLCVNSAGDVFVTLPDQPQVFARVFKGNDGLVKFLQYASAGAKVWPVFEKLEKLLDSKIFLEEIS